jgi:hypothetical protein
MALAGIVGCAHIKSRTTRNIRDQQTTANTADLVEQSFQVRLNSFLAFLFSLHKLIRIYIYVCMCATPCSGPMRFSYIAPNSANNIITNNGAEGPVWFYTRDNITLGTLIDQEVRSVLAAEVGEGQARSWPGVAVK